MNKDKIIIAIDGYSSTGKSSFAKQIATKLGYVYIDTGAMYRAVTLFCIENGCVDNAEKIISNLSNINIEFKFNSQLGYCETFLNGKNVESQIRGIDVSNNVSFVSTIPEVRARMVALQQEMGKAKGIVMDGRDIGTVVFPEAEIKIFMTAEPKVRALRRYHELVAKGDDVAFEEIEKNVLSRDSIDTSRKTSPLKAAADAIVLDNTNLSPADQMLWFDKLIAKFKI